MIARRLSRCLSVSAVATSLVACTITPARTDGGTDAGTQTVGDQCSALASAFCSHAIGECGFASTVADCTSMETAGCCSTASACAVVSLTTPSALDACTAAIAVEDCNSVVTVGPAGLTACQGIPQHQ